MRTILKVFITVLPLFFMIWSLGSKACVILVLQPGIEPAPAALEGEVLTTAVLGMSLYIPLALSPFLCLLHFFLSLRFHITFIRVNPLSKIEYLFYSPL